MSSYIDLSQSPYWDDFDPSKKFARVLFKPGYPVQARELTQLQTIIQKQIEQFGRHIFKEGSLVYGGQFNIDNTVPFVKINLLDHEANTVSPGAFIGTTILGRSSGIRAYVVNAGTYTVDEVDQNVLFVRYLSGTEYSNVFSDAEIVDTETIIPGASIAAVVASASATGNGSMFSIEEGVVFTNNFFAKFDKQNIILSPFSQEPTCRVGFNINFSVVDSGKDLSLLDNSQGFLNYASPGADRLKIDPTLAVLEINNTVDLPEFVELFSIRDGVIQERYERPMYAIIGDEIAKRTFDESGDYCVRGFGVRIREHLNTGSNEGYLLDADGGDENLLAIGIEPGLAYVKGYEINKLVTNYIPTEKSSDSVFVNSQIVSGNAGNYVIIEEIKGLPKLDFGTQINLYDTAETRITSNELSSAAPSGSLIGTARVKGLRYESGTLGTPSGKMRLYLYDIKMTTGIFSDVRAVYVSSPVHFFADVEVNTPILFESSTYPHIYKAGAAFVKTIRDSSDASDTTFTFQRTKHDITIATAGTFSIPIATSNEAFPYGVATLSSIDKQSMVLSLNAAATSAQVGTVAGTSSQATLTGTNTKFTYLNVGDKIEISGNRYKVDTITSDVLMTIAPTLSTSPSGTLYTKEYDVGDIIDLNSKGSTNGIARSVTGTTATNLSVDLNETFDATINASASFLVTRSSAEEIKKILKAKRFVKIDCSTVPDLTLPINLGFSDIYKIRQIRKHSSDFSLITDGSLVTDDFIIDNGQRDDVYEHGKIKIKPDAASLTNTDYLLVELDYFLPDYSAGFGYFSIDSYPIDDAVVADSSIMTHEIPIYKSANGVSYDLRNNLDFRSIKTNTANDSTTIAGASSNPANSSTLFHEANGIRAIYPSSQIIFDYSYYLARRDVIVIDKTGSFGIIKGQSAIYPVTPNVSENVMGVAKIYIPPYPSLSSTYARILGREDIGCKSTRITFDRHTMRDIGVIKNRVNRLEYYSAISLLETQTKELLVLDENGDDRFKNGFFVDGYIDHSLGATYNDDYKCSIDSREKVLRPFFKMNSFPYEYLVGSSSNVQQTGPLLTLPYTETTYLEQTKATTYRNIDQSVYRFIGILNMLPDTDVWVDTYTVDKTIDQDFSVDLPISSLETQWDSWQTVVVGYNVYDARDGRKGELVGTYTTYRDALQAANRINDTGAIIETIEEQERTGTELLTEDVTTSENIGTFVTDVSLIPYIRPQLIRIHCFGMKPNTRFHIFFDGENMNSYFTPMVIPEAGPDFATQYLAEGANIVSNSSGDILGFLRLPGESEKRFRIGTREIRLTDSPTNSVDATGYTIGYFVASGLIQQKQNTILSTKQTIIHQETTSDSRELTKVQQIPPPAPELECMGYSFHVKAPPGEDGIFLTSVDVFIQSLHSSLGVIFEIREMNSAGGITRTQVPYSEVWMRRDDPRLQTSEDGSVATNVNFVCPIFLLHDTQYAFVIHTEGGNPDTYFWISRLGEQDLITGSQVTARQFTGNVYTTNNNLNWDIVPDIDLKIRFNRASFNTAVTGIVGMGNKPQEFWQITREPSYFVHFGETIRGSDVLALSSITGDAIAVGDTIVGGTSNTSAEVLRITGSTYYMSDYGYTANEPITVTAKNTTANISTVTYGTAKLDSFDRRTSTMYLTNSTGLFEEGMTIKGLTTNTESSIVSINNYIYSTLNYQPDYIVFTNTTCDFFVKGFGTATQTMGNYLPIIPKRDFEFSTEQQLLAKSDEILLNSNAASSQTKAEMRTTSDWVSPILDMSRTHAVFVGNIINDDITGEDSSSGGSLLNKYISKTVTLAEGQDAEDLYVEITAYCPPGTTTKFPIKAWMKIRHDEDGDQFSEKMWIELINLGETTYSSLANKYDFKAYRFKVPTEMMVGGYDNNSIRYISNSNNYDGFKQFAVKVGLLGTDSAIVPRVSDLKVIALQM